MESKKPSEPLEPERWTKMENEIKRLKRQASCAKKSNVFFQHIENKGDTSWNVILFSSRQQESAA